MVLSLMSGMVKLLQKQQINGRYISNKLHGNECKIIDVASIPQITCMYACYILL